MTKIRLRLLLFIIICLSFISTPFTILSSSDFDNIVVESHRIIDLSTGRISGDRAQYFIDFTSLPSDWTDNIVAQRDIIGGTSAIVERVRVYVRSFMRPTRDQLQLLFAIYVVDRNMLDDELNIPYEIVSRSRDFVFAVRYGTNGFTDPIDISYFIVKMLPLNTAIQMRRFITFPESQMIDHRNTAFIYGVPMNNPIRRIDGVVFIQLREAAEIMGYTIGWNERTNSVTVRRGVTNDSFRIYNEMTHDHRGIPMRLLNGRTYVATAYFSSILNCHISLDPRTNNISISSR